ncbi:hypothetical protein N431DRAFT_500069 [Stipitochalara longipes BDJ]|nr:hypothetical protein N431DRAFT_500069 [Stipitochalara longipes BDJ]
MAITVCGNSLFLWRNFPKEFPLGDKTLRPLLIVRAIGGVLAAIGFYSSLQYMPLSEATVLNFLAPLGSCCAVALISSGSFTSVEITSAFLSLTGVILIARPAFLFGTGYSDAISTLKPGSHILGIGFAVMGAVGGVCAYTTIRIIGKRTHPLTSVNYFAAALLLVCVVAFAVFPGIHFSFAINSTQWILLILIGVFGLLMEFMLTAGLSQEKSHRATYMIYSQALVTFILDGVIWLKTPGVLSLSGCLLISVGLAIVTLLGADSQGPHQEKIGNFGTGFDSGELLPVDEIEH